jgi:hypothetical protein
MYRIWLVLTRIRYGMVLPSFRPAVALDTSESFLVQTVQSRTNRALQALFQAFIHNPC